MLDLDIHVLLILDVDITYFAVILVRISITS